MSQDPVFMFCGELSDLLHPSQAVCVFKCAGPFDADSSAGDEPEVTVTQIGEIIHRLNTTAGPILAELRAAMAVRAKSMELPPPIESLLLPVPELPQDGVTA